MKQFYLICFFTISSNINSQNKNDTTSSICEFPGGQTKMMEIIKNNLIYPQSAKTDKIEGKCYIRFVVDTLGNPTNIQVQKSLRGDCDTAAMKAVSYLTGWKPAKNKGKKAPINCAIPITYNPIN
jgi:TonB family protein